MRIERIGDAVLYLGDCLQILPTLDKVDAVVTDPPYGTTECAWDSVICLETMWKSLKSVAYEKTPILLFAAQPFTTSLISSNMKGFKFCFVWEKSQAVGHLNAWRQPMRKTEDIVVFYNSQPTYRPTLIDKPIINQRPQTQRTKKSECYGQHGLSEFRCPADKSMPSNIIMFNNEQGTIHPTQKPVMLLEYLISTYTSTGETVLDFTMGSGTTGVACANLGRKFIGIEINEDYFNISVERITAAQAQLRLFA